MVVSLNLLTVRSRANDDLPALRQLAEEVHSLDGYPPRLPQDLGRFIAAPDALASFVATANGRIVGHVCVSPLSSPAVLRLAEQALGVQRENMAVIARLLVSPAARRQGVARALLTEAVAEAHRLDRTPILDVATHFTDAFALRGFVPDDVGSIMAAGRDWQITNHTFMPRERDRDRAAAWIERAVAGWNHGVCRLAISEIEDPARRCVGQAGALLQQIPGNAEAVYWLEATSACPTMAVSTCGASPD